MQIRRNSSPVPVENNQVTEQAKESTRPKRQTPFQNDQVESAKVPNSLDAFTGRRSLEPIPQSPQQNPPQIPQLPQTGEGQDDIIDNVRKAVRDMQLASGGRRDLL